MHALLPELLLRHSHRSEILQQVTLGQRAGGMGGPRPHATADTGPPSDDYLEKLSARLQPCAVSRQNEEADHLCRHMPRDQGPVMSLSKDIALTVCAPSQPFVAFVVAP